MGIKRTITYTCDHCDATKDNSMDGFRLVKTSFTLPNGDRTKDYECLLCIPCAGMVADIVKPPKDAINSSVLEI